VKIFQKIAPNNADKITEVLIISGSTNPTPIVVATCTPKNKNAIKLKKAAHSTAQCGLSNRVETIAAMELAASWKPFKKSKNNASPIVKITIISDESILRIL
jgi:hypothetical protein